MGLNAVYYNRDVPFTLKDAPDVGEALPATDPSKYGNRPQAVYLQSHVAAFRFTVDGSDPTSGYGMEIPVDQPPFLYTGTLPDLKFVQVDDNGELTVVYVQSIADAIQAYVLSFNGRSGSVTLSDSDVANALGYAPVESIVAGSGVTVNATDPTNPVVSASGGGGGASIWPALIFGG